MRDLVRATGFSPQSISKQADRLAEAGFLLVVGSVSLSRTLDLTRPVQETIGREINPVVMTTGEFCRRRADKEHFISSVLSGKTVTLVGELAQLG